ncbi:MAG: CheY-like chemotaxis protein [Bacteriovoracaceae bacterium]|jgi:two-component system nitrogen regulation response regulator NtrX
MSFEKLKGTRILIVDDEQLLRETIEMHLELEGVIVSHASDGKEAFDLITKNKYNVVLSDIRMPGCSGIKLLEMVRASSLKTPPIVLMSAFTDISEDKAKELGARGMFLKPTDMSYLKELLVESLENF